MDTKEYADHNETAHSLKGKQEIEKAQPRGDKTLIPRPTNDPNDPLVSEENSIYTTDVGN